MADRVSSRAPAGRDVVTGSGRNLLLRRMLGLGRVLETADAGFFMSQRNHEKMLCFRAEKPRIVR